MGKMPELTAVIRYSRGEMKDCRELGYVQGDVVFTAQPRPYSQDWVSITWGEKSTWFTAGVSVKNV